MPWVLTSLNGTVHIRLQANRLEPVIRSPHLVEDAAVAHTADPLPNPAATAAFPLDIGRAPWRISSTIHPADRRTW
jgi:hypothetical protein